MAGGKLLVVATPPARLAAHGRVVLSRKFVEGMQRYAGLWDGPVAALVPPGQDTVNLDCKAWDTKRLGFELHVEPFQSGAFDRRIAGSSVVLGGPHHQLPGLSRRCKLASVPSVYNTEYTLRTRLQITRAGNRSPLAKARSLLWELGQERRYRAELRDAAAVQCNGTPTFEAYADVSPERLLYFDSRITNDLLAADADLQKRRRRVHSGAPLHLAFSGRLAPLKGADHLVDVCTRLRALGVDFEMSIFGAGSLEESIRTRVDRAGASRQVHLRGVLDFRKELVPLFKEEVDLFVCCHRQGDPSCTYLETLSAGVPIVGYANEAFSGLLKKDDIGWPVPMNRPDLMASRIQRLDRQRGEILRKAESAVRFAYEHTFEKTFLRRVEHLRAVADRCRLRSARL